MRRWNYNEGPPPHVGGYQRAAINPGFMEREDMGEWRVSEWAMRMMTMNLDTREPPLKKLVA